MSLRDTVPSGEKDVEFVCCIFFQVAFGKMQLLTSWVFLKVFIGRLAPKSFAEEES